MTVYTHTAAQPADATLEISLVPKVPDPVEAPDPLVWQINYAGVDIDPWITVSGQPRAIPELGVALRSSAGLGEHTTSEGRTGPAELSIDASIRWIATSYDNVAGRWNPLLEEGGLTWNAPAGAAPEGLDAGYSFDRDDDEAPYPAVVFAGGQRLELTAASPAWLASALTVVAVLVLHPTDADAGGLVETAAGPGVGFGIRYAEDEVSAWTDQPVASHTLKAGVGKPIVVALALDGTSGSFSVVEADRSSVSFAAPSPLPLSLSLVLGQDRDGNTAIADFLEVDLWLGRALDAGELGAVFAELDDTYGISR